MDDLKIITSFNEIELTPKLKILYFYKIIEDMYNIVKNDFPLPWLYKQAYNF